MVLDRWMTLHNETKRYIHGTGLTLNINEEFDTLFLTGIYLDITIRKHFSKSFCGSQTTSDMHVVLFKKSQVLILYLYKGAI